MGLFGKHKDKANEPPAAPAAGQAAAEEVAVSPPEVPEKKVKKSIFFRKKAKDHKPEMNLTPEEKEQIKGVFLKLDTDHSKSLDKLEIVIGLREMGHPNPTVDSVNSMLKSVHLDGHHDVTLEEFEIMWKNKPADGWDFASHIGGFMSGAAAGMASMVGGEAYVQGGEAPRGKPIQHVHYRTIYNLGQQLGKGAFSKVYRGFRKDDTTIEFAIKVVQKSDVPDAADVDALFEEVGILQQIHHPNIMRLYEFYEDDTEYALVTEIVEGGELFDRIVELQHYSEKEARDLVAIFLQTLDFLHSNGIVHRDLKPENLLLATKNDDHHIKIADFGFAKHISQRLDTVCGTPDYIAPEVCSLMGTPKKERVCYTEKCDIWSAGVIVYILVAGYPPFYDDNQKKLFAKIKKGRFEFHEEYWGGVSEEAKDLITRMLTVDPALRPTAAQLLEHPWLQSSPEMLSAQKLQGTKSELKKWAARRKLRAACKTIIAVRRMGALLKGHHDADAAAAAEEQVEDSEHPDAAAEDAPADGAAASE